MISFSILIGPLSLAAGILLLLIVLVGFLWLTGKIEGYDPVNEMLFRDNPALGSAMRCLPSPSCFALLGIFDRSQGDSGAWFFAQHAILAVLMIYLSRYLNDWLILYHFSNNREVVQEKNVAVALVEGATYMASAYVIAGAFYDWENGLLVALVWFLIGQLLLIVLAALLPRGRPSRRRRARRKKSRRRHFAQRFSALRRDGLRRGHQRTVAGLASRYSDRRGLPD